MTSTELKEIKLRFLEGENEGIEIRLEVPREVVIGRGEDCDIYLGEKKISRRHAKLITSKESFIIEDLKSTNGTFVNGKRVQREHLSNEDTVRVGSSVFQIDFIYDDIRASSSPIADLISQPSVKSSPAVSVPKAPPPPPPRSVAPPTPPPAAPRMVSNPSPELEEMEELDSIEIDIVSDHKPNPPPSPPRIEVSGGRTKGLSGNLSAIPLPDLLQTFGNGSKTGVLKLVGPQRGQIYLHNGGIQYACLDQGATGEKALFRMLAWKEAEFDLMPLPSDFSPPASLGEKLTTTTENLLIEGFRQLDEMETIKKTLPPGNTRLKLNAQMDNPLSRLHPKVLDVLQLALQYGEVNEIMNRSSFSDLETAKIIFYLIKKKYLAAS